jgi:hypothetical protein
MRPASCISRMRSSTLRTRPSNDLNPPVAGESPRTGDEPAQPVTAAAPDGPAAADARGDGIGGPGAVSKSRDSADAAVMLHHADDLASLDSDAVALHHVEREERAGACL